MDQNSTVISGAGDSKPLVSVIIPTVNREQELCDTIRYFLEAETYSPFELIVVDQTETHAQETLNYLSAVSSRINYIKSDYRNLPAARNVGIKHARGSIVVFVDDDVRIVNGFLSAHVAPYSNPEIVGVSGMILEEKDRILSRDEVDENTKKEIAALRFVSCIVDFSYYCGYAFGGNMSFRKEWLERLGGFDENFTGCALGEDIELSYRIIMQGGRIFYNPQAKLFHFNKATGGTRMANRYPYESSQAYCYNYFMWKIKYTVFMRWSKLLRRMYEREFTLNKILNGSFLPLSYFFLLGVWESSRKINSKGILKVSR